MIYADKGNGVSIGFDTIKLLYSNDFSLGCVIYDKEKQTMFMKSFIQELAKFVEDLKSLKTDDSSVQDYTNWAVLTAAMLVKANDWKYESEWRLIRWKHLDLTEFDNGGFWRREKFQLKTDPATNTQHNDELSVEI